MIINPEATIETLIATTRENRISGVPVVDGEKLVGIITTRDIRFLDRIDLKVKDVMTPKERLLTAKEGASNEEIKRILHERPAYIFHLAAFFANQNSVDYPEKDLLVSQLGTIKMLEHAVLQGGIKRFVYAGSGCAIYGAQKQNTWNRWRRERSC
mgnify:CR=1 FL=1